MDNSSKKKQFIIYIILISFVFLGLFLVRTFVSGEDFHRYRTVTKSTITYKDDVSDINFEYPRFTNDDINKIITDYVYAYVKEFKEFDMINKVLDVSYNLYYFEGYVNIVFNIENSIDKIKYKNILINLEDSHLAYISNIYNRDDLDYEIDNLVYYKYSSDIYELVKDSNINNHTYVINENKIDVYFNDIDFSIIDVDYIPYVTIELVADAFEYDEGYAEGQKFIVFSFDDGPSEYTENILRTLEANNSSATFFMLGNRMKYNEEVVMEIYNSNSEVASHTYSHKDLTKLSQSELDYEINNSNIIYNQITGDNIKYIRPPYGSYTDDMVNNTKIPFVLWNVDPKDWLVRDTKTIYNNVINNACDGCIVLFHDSYVETHEAIKLLIPKLNELGYNVVSISKLIKYRGENLKNPQIVNPVISSDIINNESNQIN